jgi:uncharacterized protein
MHLTTYQNPHEFIARTHDVFLQNEAANSLILGISSNLERDDILTEYTARPYLATVDDDSTLVLAAVMTPPYNIILYTRPADYQQALELLIQDIRTYQLVLPGCNGPEPLASEFAHLWQQHTSQPYHIDVNERLFILTSVTPPPTAPGILRPATDDDFPLANQWLLAFRQETNPHDLDQQLIEAANRRKIHDGDIYLWELPHGETVSLVGRTRPLVHTISIAPVYTPPQYRGKGYASNCVAALTQHLLDSGWQSCCLFTDLANPTSNSIYQKIGYRPICDFTIYRFEH